MTRRPRTARPRPSVRTWFQEQADADEQAYAAQQHIAARQAFRAVMLSGHGCTGKDCASPDHEQNLKWLLEDSLMAMGILPDPEAGARNQYHWGAPPRASTGER